MDGAFITLYRLIYESHLQPKACLNAEESSVMRKVRLTAVVLVLGLLILAPQVFSKGKETDPVGAMPGGPAFFKSSTIRSPHYQNCTHRYNNMFLTVSNFGIIGAMMESYIDCETGMGAPSCEFPAGTQLDYLYATGLWVGAIVGSDTLVSAGWNGWSHPTMEMWPCAGPECGLGKRSNRLSDPNYSDSAKSDLEYVAVYTDTLIDATWTGTDWGGIAHQPLNIEVTQTSYSWSVAYAQDFILIDYRLKNIGNQKLNKVYIGLYVDGDVSHVARDRGSWTDDVCGFRKTVPSKVGSNYEDTINLAWIADNDGDPNPDNRIFDHKSVCGLTGVRVMRTPKQLTHVSFNWWTSHVNPSLDWGPMLEASRRNYGTGGLGTPEGDRNKYYMMSNGEQDYDQIFAVEDYTADGWYPPNQGVGAQIAQGGDTRYLLSVGPFDVVPGETLPMTIAYVGGERFHKNPNDFRENIVESYKPDEFYSRLDFSDVGTNAVWASWVYDNPGIDTDGDGYAGPYWEIEDTLPNGEIEIRKEYYAGDGVPDFRAVEAPPPPVLRVSTAIEQVTLRFNGLVSETSIDPFTKLRDFEGYRVYMGRHKRADKLALLESRDRLDFTRFYWDPDDSNWAIADKMPLTLDSLRKCYNSDFDPLEYGCPSDCNCPPGGTGYIDDGITYCFEPVGWNESIRGWGDGASDCITSEIRKRFADEIADGKVTSDLDSTIAENWTKDIDPLTGDSVLYHKYYEYEFVIDSLLPSVPWYFSVTAFDFGDLVNGLDPLESSPLANIIEVWSINDANEVLKKRLKVVAYPNPYIGDGRYFATGYEDPERTGFVDHERRMHFLNLPPHCTIKIFTLNGDLVRVLVHPGASSDTESKIHWNMRSTNNEIVASGIYIFAVESELGNQIGKIVIIL